MKLGKAFSLMVVGALGLQGCLPNHPVEALAGQLACSYKDGVHQVSSNVLVMGDEVVLGGYPAQSLVRSQNGTWVVSGFLLEDKLVSEDRPVDIRTGSDIFRARATFRTMKEGDVVEVGVRCVGIE